MKNVNQYTGKLEIIDRLNNSRNGNPRFMLKVGDVVCYTAVDSALGYSVSNYEGKEVTASIGLHYGKSTIQSISAIK